MIPYLKHNGISFPFSLPTQLKLDFINDSQRVASIMECEMMNSECFKHLFVRLNSLSIQLGNLNFIPFDLLFDSDKKSNYYENDECRQYIQNLTLTGRWDFDMYNQRATLDKQLHNACEKFNNLKIKCKQNNRKLRKIREFSCSMNGYSKANSISALLLATFGNISESIDISSNIMISSIDQLAAIFHKNLKMVKLHATST